MLKLGWTYNNLRDDGMARAVVRPGAVESGPARVAAEAAPGYANLRQGLSACAD